MQEAHTGRRGLQPRTREKRIDTAPPNFHLVAMHQPTPVGAVCNRAHVKRHPDTAPPTARIPRHPRNQYDLQNFHLLAMPHRIQHAGTTPRERAAL